MGNSYSQAVDITQGSDMRRDGNAAHRSYLPCPPVLSSGANWQGIALEFHRQPACQTPIVFHQQYCIAIHTGVPIWLEQVSDLGQQADWVGAGDVFISPPKFCRCYHWQTEAEFLLLRLESSVLRRVAAELRCSEVTIAPVFRTQDPLIHGIGMALKTAVETQTDTACYAEALGRTLALHLVQWYGQRSCPFKLERSPKMQRVMDYIQVHLTEELSLEVLAQEAGVSLHRFAHLFKQEMGLSPHRYVVQCRVEQAKALLQQRDASVGEVAKQVGFADASHFGRWFRKLTGMTPSEYREEKEW